LLDGPAINFKRLGERAMLKNDHPLYFPKIVLRGEVAHWNAKKAKSEDSCSDGKINIYKLDWEISEKIKIKQHEEWRDYNWAGKNIPYVPILPEKWEKELNNLYFYLNYNYLRHIRENAKTAIDEWSTHYCFDKMVRE